MTAPYSQLVLLDYIVRYSIVNKACKCLLPPFDLTEVFTKVEGTVPWLRKTSNLVVAAGTVRLRADDVMPPKDLARHSQQYRNRLKFGACLRADIVTEFEAGTQKPYRIARILGCSYEPVHRIVAELILANAAEA